MTDRTYTPGYPVEPRPSTDVFGPTFLQSGLTNSKCIAFSATPAAYFRLPGDPSQSKPAAVIPLAGPTRIPPNSVVRISGLISSTAGSLGLVASVGAEVVAQWFPGGTMRSHEFVMQFYVGPDGKFAQNKIVTQTAIPEFGGIFTSDAQITTIDFNVDQTLTLLLAPTVNDVCTLHGWAVEVFSGEAVNYAGARALALWGDSLTSGVGASANLSIPSRFMRTSPNTDRAVFDGGVASQKSYQILARILADKVRGRVWTCAFWMGANNVGEPTYVDDVVRDVSSAVANMTHSRFVVLSVLSSSAFPIGHPAGFWEQTATINTRLASMFPSNFLDVRTPLIGVNMPGGGGDDSGTVPASKRADAIHLNDTGYAEVYTLLSAFLLSKGW